MPVATLDKALTISISESNIKMDGGDAKIFSISFPPIPGVCHEHAPCLYSTEPECYAIRMYNRAWQPNIKEAWDKNLYIWDSHREVFKEQLLARFEKAQKDFDEKGKLSRYRNGVGGEILDVEFLELLNACTRVAPDIPVMAFTKRHDVLIEAWKAGVTIDFKLFWSKWPGRSIPPIVRRYGLNISYLSSDEAASFADVRVCPGKCGACGYTCWELAQDVLFHDI